MTLIKSLESICYIVLRLWSSLGQLAENYKEDQNQSIGVEKVTRCGSQSERVTYGSQLLSY